MDQHSKNQHYPPGPPPAYSELPLSFPSDNANISYQPNYLPNLPNVPNASINSSVIPILPSAPVESHHIVPNYGSTVILVNEPAQRPLPSESFVCPVCHIGLLEKEFTILGLFLAIFLFPFGLLCLFILRKWRCSLCGASLGY